ncbi:hypothetical protein [Sphingomonas sp.]|jgi:hypothetical protein|uniref:hypothetical protein n=1 Tax=Sphingomonas sp. TaxID=28214 RepID=UPI002E1088FA|nr:hypothetical protein [Sphingomonas sp.]
MGAARSTVWRDNAVAAGLALLLAVVWAWRDWAALSALRLPDTDDVMRLQQMRDWLGGQGFSDLAQHRLGVAGLEMHWSRLPDLVPGAIIALLTPVTGAYAAELAAVILWPLLLLAVALMLVAAIARRVAVSALVAVVITALAYPASALFLPGRIDHHGLQLVLLLVLVRAVIGCGGWRCGVAAGVASVASLVVGMETAPFLALGGGVLVMRWVVAGQGERPRLLGYGASLVLGFGLAAILFRTSGWDAATCDAFAAPLWRAAQVGALAPVGLALAGRWFDAPRTRLVAAVALGGAALAVALTLSPACLSPYGGVDPLLERLWLARVAEAQPLFAAPLDHAIGYVGLALAGLAATLWQWRRTRDTGWAVLAGFQLAALALALVQLRGIYAGTMLAAPGLAALIAYARERGPMALAAAWVTSAGFLYPALGSFAAPPPPAATCDGGAVLAQLAAQPAGTVAAPIDLGAYALAETRHRVLAAPYHRNGVGNLAVYRLVWLPVAEARAEADRLEITYLANCGGAWDELGTPPPGSLLEALRTGNAPAWLVPMTSEAALYRVEAEK